MKKTKNKTPEFRDELYLMHDSMFRHFVEWMDEYCLRVYDFRLSELHKMEALVARFATNPDLGPEGLAVRDRLIEEYNRIWRPRRMKLEEVL